MVSLGGCVSDGEGVSDRGQQEHKDEIMHYVDIWVIVPQKLGTCGTNNVAAASPVRNFLFRSQRYALRWPLLLADLVDALSGGNVTHAYLLHEANKLVDTQLHLHGCMSRTANVNLARLAASKPLTHAGGC